MKLLIHTPISNRAWCLPEFLGAIDAQCLADKARSIRYRFDVNDTQDDSLGILKGFASTGRNVEIIEHSWLPLNMADHQWNPERYNRMILLRNSALLAARDSKCDFLFSIDSDVILQEPDALSHLLDADSPIIAGVFMAQWGNPDAPPLPNVWQCGQNEMTDDFLQGIAMAREHQRVGGLGACTLIRRDVLEAGVSYDPIYNLPSYYRGEDRNFCIRAVVHGFKLTACSHKRIRHVDREMSQTKRMAI